MPLLKAWGVAESELETVAATVLDVCCISKDSISVDELLDILEDQVSTAAWMRLVGARKGDSEALKSPAVRDPSRPPHGNLSERDIDDLVHKIEARLKRETTAKKVVEVFEDLADRDKTISKRQLGRALETLRVQLRDSELSAVFDRFDKIGDGRGIDYLEFLNAVGISGGAEILKHDRADKK